MERNASAQIRRKNLNVCGDRQILRVSYVAYVVQGGFPIAVFGVRLASAQGALNGVGMQARKSKCQSAYLYVDSVGRGKPGNSYAGVESGICEFACDFAFDFLDDVQQIMLEQFSERAFEIGNRSGKLLKYVFSLVFGVRDVARGAGRNVSDVMRGMRRFMRDVMRDMFGLMFGVPRAFANPVS